MSYTLPEFLAHAIALENEAAERYRTWATGQRWCRRGTLRERVVSGDACRWLLEEIGAPTLKDVLKKF